MSSSKKFPRSSEIVPCYEVTYILGKEVTSTPKAKSKLNYVLISDFTDHQIILNVSILSFTLKVVNGKVKWKKKKCLMCLFCDAHS